MAPPRGNVRVRGGRESALWVAALVVLPLVGYAACQHLTALPRTLRMATGPLEGRYRDVAVELAVELEARLPLEVELVESGGSLENLDLLASHAVDVALYQQGSAELLGIVPPGDLRLVARLYSEPVQILVRQGAGIDDATQLAGRRVNLGSKGSGDSATGQLVLSHLGLEPEDIEAEHLDYEAAHHALAEGRLDAAIVTIGVRAQMFPQLLAEADVHVLDMPWRDALLRRSPFLVPYRVPAGSYGRPPHVEPEADVETVATAAQLVVRADLPNAIAEELGVIVHDQRFQRRLGLGELFAAGAEFSLDRPDFPVHAGTLRFHDPGLRPLVDPQFAEATENLRSLVFSTLIAGFLGWRWIRKIRDRRREHRLDRYVRALLGIERRQQDLDSGTEPGARPAEILALGALLDEVTVLRQEALAEFSAHELNEDHGLDSFVSMCHALSNKINAKLTRLRFDQALAGSSCSDGIRDNRESSTVGELPRRSVVVDSERQEQPPGGEGAIGE